MTVLDIFRLIDEIAPFETQSEFDNSGFLVGTASREVSTVLFSLDLTDPVIDEALSLGAQLIVTHHPLMFSPLRALTDADYEGRLIMRLVREDISHIAAHTNLDQASGGINDTLAACCGLTGITGDGFFRSGMLPGPLSAAQFAAKLKTDLNTDVRLMGSAEAVVRKVGLCSGGGSDEWQSAVNAHCDAFISGEIKHHHALALADRGIVAMECGHFATEEPGIRSLALALQNKLYKIKYNVRIFVSEISAYSFPRQP